jgi:hypothetical protein
LVVVVVVVVGGGGGGGGGVGVGVGVAVVAATFMVVVFNAQELWRIQEVTLIHYGVNFFAQDMLWGWIH